MSAGRLMKALGLRKVVEVEAAPAGAFGRGLADRDGNPVMSRVDPATGRSLGFETRGFDGRGTLDEARARNLAGGAR